MPKLLGASKEKNHVPSRRAAIPRPTRDQVLREFNHRCAVCGTANPHLHHIDRDHSNNDILNLLPLCPNCHLTDQHDPTQPLDSARLRLFRRYKAPAILSPEFEPLHCRLRFLDHVSADSADVDTLEINARELVDFIGALEMGAFYSKRIGELVARPEHPRAWSLSTPDSEIDRWLEEDRVEYVQKLMANREQVNRLAVELLRYQGWRDSKPSPGGS